MSVFNTSQAPNPSVNIGGVLTPSIINFPLTLSNTEYTIVLPVGTQRFQIKSRGKHILKLSYTLNQSNSVYLSIWPGDAYHEFGIDSSSSLTVYVQSTGTGEIVEIVSWS